MSFYDLLWIFLIYAFLGWCCEVAFAALTEHKFVNRGFLGGPVCPIYGVGIAVVVLCLTPIMNNLILLFIGSFLLTSLLEFVTGLVLEKLFRLKWWDYSMFRFNIKGYICLRFSLLWAVSCTAVLKLFHPLVMWLVHLMPMWLGITLASIFFAVLAADVTITLTGMLKLPRTLRAFTEVQTALRKVSDELGEGLYDTVTAAERTGSALLDDFSERRAELESRAEKLKIAMQQSPQYARIAKAFPNIRRGSYGDVFERIKSYAANKKEKERSDENN